MSDSSSIGSKIRCAAPAALAAMTTKCYDMLPSMEIEFHRLLSLSLSPCPAPTCQYLIGSCTQGGHWNNCHHSGAATTDETAEATLQHQRCLSQRSRRRRCLLLSEAVSYAVVLIWHFCAKRTCQCALEKTLNWIQFLHLFLWYILMNHLH